jgi:AraC-like DNA-binding protein
MLSGNSMAQLTEAQLIQAVQSNQCNDLEGQFDAGGLFTEEMKFNGAICFYRNGQVEKAYALFDAVHQMQAKRWRGALFWKAKIHAALRQDSLAVAALQALPAGVLQYQMIAQPEFDALASSNEYVSSLRKTLAPRFNGWTSILGIIACIGLLASVILFFGKSRFTDGSKWLALVVFSFSVILIAYVSIWTQYVFQFPYLRSCWPWLTLLVGPSLFFYLKATFKEEYSSREVASHFIIPTISFVLLLPAMLGDFGLSLARFSDLVTIGSAPTLLTAHVLFYTLRIHFLVQNDWQVDANIKAWTRIVDYGMKIFMAAFLSYFILVNTSFFNPAWDYSISLVMAISILMITYMGFVQKRVFQSEPIETFLPVQKYQSSSLTPTASESIRKRLERYLTEEQVFKENELRLDDLAAYLDISRHELSRVINEHYQVNFFELINRHRVAYVAKMLSDPAHDQDTIIQLAYEAGFNNKVSFNRYFKQATGLTPSAFRIREREHEKT